MADTPARRGPGRPRKVTPPTKADEPTAEEVAREKVAEAAPFLTLTPEAAAAHVSEGDAAKVAIPEAAIEGEDDNDVEPDRREMVFHPDATHVGFDDGSQYHVKDGKITRRVKGS